MSTNSHFAAITPSSVASGTIMFVSPQQGAATQLAHLLTKKFIHDLYESLPAGSVSETEVTKLMGDVKSFLLTGKGISDSFGALAGLITDSSAPPASAAAGVKLAGLINGVMVKDIITLVAPIIPAAEVKSSIALLKTDLKSGLGIEPWLKSMVAVFSGLVPSTHGL